MRYKTLGALIFISLLVSGCSFSLAADVTPPPGAEQMMLRRTQSAPASGLVFPLVPPDSARGQETFKDKCAPCHGLSGQGDGERAVQLSNPVPAIGSVEFARQASPSGWFNVVTEGNLERFMPPFPSLSDSQRWDVVAYTLSLSASSENIQQGASLYQTYCARCHGDQGKGDGPDAEGLQKAPTNLTDLAFIADRSAMDLYQSVTVGLPPVMPSYVGLLSEENRWAVVEYLQSLTFTRPPELPEVVVTQPVSDTNLTEASVTPNAATPVAGEQAPLLQGFGTVTGKVTNGSGGEVPEKMTVLLSGFDEVEVVITQTATLRPDRSFIFPGVEMMEGRVFLATVDYGNTTYASDVSVVAPNSSTMNLPITIYDTTTDPEVIKVDRLHLFFEMLDEETIRVVELYIMSNTSDKTLLPIDDKQPSVRFKLPVGSSNLEFQDDVLGGRYIPTPDGFGDTFGVRPGIGNYQILFSFTMPYNRKLDLVQPLLLPVDAVVILVPEGSIRIRSTMLADDGKRDVEGTVYHLYSGGSIAAGQDLRLTITGGLGGAAFSLSEGSQNSLIIGLSVLGIALIVAGIWFYRHTQVEEVDDISSGEATAEDIEAAMDSIIALDDLYQSGEIAEDAYHKRRAEYKDQLKEMKG